jgi:hypothetical protein
VLAGSHGPGRRPPFEEGGREKAGCVELEGEAGGDEAARVGVEAAYDAEEGLRGGHEEHKISSEWARSEFKFNDETLVGLIYFV